MNKYSYTFSTPSGKTKTKLITLSTKLILQEAEKLGINWDTVPNTEIINLSFNNRTVQFFHQQSPLNTHLAIYSCEQKNITKTLLENSKISVARGFIISNKDFDKHNDRNNSEQTYVEEIFKNLNKPLVIKPQQGSQGTDVTVDIKTKENFEKIVKQTLDGISDKKIGVLVEEMFVGTEYRISLTRDKIVGVTNRIPANVTGDGQSTIKELIIEKNKDPRREDYYYNTGLIKIPINDETIWAIEKQGLTLETIPKNDQLIYVRLNSNLSTGGDSIDFTDKIHPSVKEIALKAINAIPGLEFAGLDFMCKDITKEQTKNSYIIVEINTSPGIFMHDKPYIGKNRHAAKKFLYLMFPELKKTNCKLY